MTQFDWMAACKEYDAKGRMKHYRKVVAYAAVALTADTDETYEEFKAHTSGHVTPWSYCKHIEMTKDRAIEAWNRAVRNGFIDC